MARRCTRRCTRPARLLVEGDAPSIRRVRRRTTGFRPRRRWPELTGRPLVCRVSERSGCPLVAWGDDINRKRRLSATGPRLGSHRPTPIFTARPCRCLQRSVAIERAQSQRTFLRSASDERRCGCSRRGSTARPDRRSVQIRASTVRGERSTPRTRSLPSMPTRLARRHRTSFVCLIRFVAVRCRGRSTGERRSSS